MSGFGIQYIHGGSCDEVRERILVVEKERDELLAEIDRLRAALDEAEKALQYYAEGMGDDEEDADYIEIHKDTLSERTITYRGKKAREALKTIEKARK